MQGMGPPNRPREPINVVMMAVALVLASIAGAGIGFLIDLAPGKQAPAAPAEPT
jgi:hypothetical protein